jgi:hypothetical protein
MADKNYTFVDRRDGKGKTLAVYKFTPDSHSDKFEVIAKLVEDWAKTHPNDMREILDGAKEQRNEGNDYGSAEDRLKDKNFRRGMMLPAGLHVILKKNFPEIFEDKKLYNKFMKRFPGFVTINKI